MGITVKTTFAGVEIDAAGTIFVKASKQVSNGEQLLQSEPHRFPIDALADADQALDAMDANLIDMGFGALPGAARGLVKQLRDVAHADADIQANIAERQVKRDAVAAEAAARELAAEEKA